MAAQTTSEIAAQSTSPAVPARPKVPSVHTRALITWLAIFPLVSLGMLLLGPLMEPWHPVLRALLLTALVVPAAVYVVVPKLMAGHGALSRRAVERSAQRASRKSR
jgi:antibiotic biosynthesis monooxygenase (ABM) superfamily enzyme